MTEYSNERRYSYGSPTAMLAARMKEKHDDEDSSDPPASASNFHWLSYGSPTSGLAASIDQISATEKAEMKRRLSYGSPTSGLVASINTLKSTEEQVEKKDETTQSNKARAALEARMNMNAPSPMSMQPETPPNKRSSKARAALATRMSMGALSPTSVLVSKTDFSDSDEEENPEPTITSARAALTARMSMGALSPTSVRLSNTNVENGDKGGNQATIIPQIDTPSTKIETKVSEPGKESESVSTSRALPKAISSSNNNNFQQIGSNAVESAYLVMASLFFAACAYAQLNDPDPEWWIAGYGTGSLLSLAVLLGYKQGGVYVSTTFAAVVLGFLIYWIVELIPRLDKSLPLGDFVWHVLEFEEGREIGGLFFLLLHVLKLQQLCREGRSNHSREANSVGTIASIAVLSALTYVWIHYQPQMNMRDYIDHCSGSFRSVFPTRGAATS